MCSVNVHPRIIPLEAADPDEAPARAPVRRGGFNYGTLLRQARLRSERAMLFQLRDADAHSPRDAGRDDAALPTLPDEIVPVDEDTGDDLVEQEAMRARARRQEEHMTPFVAELAKQQARIAGLMQFLATRVVDFCSDDAIVEHGSWTIRIKLDPALIPECTLELGLSRFDLTLRFETEHETTRKLICRHEYVLKEQLVTLLQRMNTPREVSIDVS
jgi:type III secretion control protein HpaP